MSSNPQTLRELEEYQGTWEKASRHEENRHGVVYLTGIKGSPFLPWAVTREANRHTLRSNLRAK